MGRAPDLQPARCFAWTACRQSWRPKPELKDRRAVQDRDVRRPRGDREAYATRSRKNRGCHAHRDVDRYSSRPTVKKWLADSAKHPRWHRPIHGTDLPANAGSPAIPSAPTATKPTSSPAAVRTSCAFTRNGFTASRPSRSSAPWAGPSIGYDQDGKPILTKEPKLLLNDNDAGKPEGIHLMIGRRPYAAFGNSTGDQQMLEYTKSRRRRAARRCWCCMTMRSANTPTARRRACRIRKVGTFTQELYDRGAERWLDRHQHEERLESPFFFLRSTRGAQ